jgi:transcriptional regulator with XRE-family HTH domain
MDNILPINTFGHKDIMSAIANNCRRLRLDHFNWSREHLAEKSGVTASTIKRFENTGQITIENMLLLAIALQAQEPFLRLFSFPEIQSIADVEKQARRRKRGTNK